MPKTIITLVGVKRSGKSTTFNYLKEIFPSVTEITLANKLKNVCSEVFNVPRSAFDDDRKEQPLDKAVQLYPAHVVDICAKFDINNLSEGEINPHVGVILPTPRRIAQFVGTEILRSFGANIHCEHAVKDLSDNCFGVVTDCRFWNEFNYFKDNSYYFIPIYVDNKKAEEKAQGDNHASERDVLDIAKQCLFTLDNNGTLEDLARGVEEMVPKVPYYKQGKIG